MYAAVRAVLLELHGSEFTPMVGAKNTQPTSGFHLHLRLELAHGRQGVALGREKRYPHVSTPVINEKKKVAFTARRRRCDRPTEVSMD